jgi:hypothetical protein
MCLARASWLSALAVESIAEVPAKSNAERDNLAIAAELGNDQATCRAVGIQPSTHSRRNRQLDHGPKILRPPNWGGISLSTKLQPEVALRLEHVGVVARVNMPAGPLQSGTPADRADGLWPWTPHPRLALPASSRRKLRPGGVDLGRDASSDAAFIPRG